MKRHISIFTFILSVFAAGFAFEAAGATGQTVYGGYCYTGSQYRGDLRDQYMKVNDSYMPVTLSKAGDKAVCKATEPDGMRIAEKGWGHVGSTSSTVTVDVMDFDNLTWEAKSTSEYEWTYDGRSPAYVAIAVRFDYIKYTLKFVSSQGGTMPEDLAATYEQSVTIPAPSSSSAPTGYHFDKWIATSSFDKAFSADVSAGSSVSGKDFGLAGCHKDGSVITLTAQWAPNTYDVKSGGENCTVTVAASAEYDGDLAINWTPDGVWKKPTVTVYAGTDDKGTAIKTYSNLPEGTGSTTFNMSVLGAYYEKIFIKVSYEVHTLTFNPNGGSCDETSRRVERGSLIGELPVATQYQRTQEGWWDDPGAGNPITAATVYDFPGDITAYAHWKVAELFSVDTIADPEAGGTLTGGGSYAKDEQITLTATANTGYSFVKWTAKTSGEEHTDPTWPITVVAGDLYTAYFTGNVYQVTFYALDGEPAAQVRAYTFGQPFGEVPTATKQGDYELEGWYTSPMGMGVKYDGESIMDHADDKLMLFANWKTIPTYHVAYNGNGSTSGSMPNQKMYCGVAGNLTSNAYERVGYHFRGWATNMADAVALKIAYTDGALVTDIASTNETATLYAVWDAITLGEAMHCNDPSLVWESYNPKDYQTDNDWKAIFGTGVGDGTDSCVRQTGAQLSKQRWLVAKVSEEGSLSFRWKPTDVGGKLMFWVDAGKDNDAAKTEPGQSGTSGVWSTFSTNGIPAGSWVHLYFYSSTGTCDIDQMTWTPGGPEPVDGKDNVTISSAAVSADGKSFSLSFKSDAQFDYNLLTNANLLIKKGWGVMGEKKTGDGSVLTFEPEIIEGQSQLFYKVETIQRK